jgi:hypothetical protein
MYAAPATTPAAWWDDADYAPGVMDGEYIGSLGAGGLAVVMLLLLILGTRDKAKHKLKPLTALIWGFVAMTVWIGAGGIWSYPSDVLRDALAQATALGVIGTVGAGAIALATLGIVWFVDLKPRAEAIMGMIMGVTWAAAGGIWGVPVLIVAQITSGLA